MRKFVCKKDSKTDVITYMEYENLKGFDVHPKKYASFDDMINVDSMVVINPSLIEKLINKKVKRTIDKILIMLSLISEDDPDSCGLVLDEVARLKGLINEKYKNYVDSKTFKALCKRVGILEKEVCLRIDALSYSDVNTNSGPRR